MSYASLVKIPEKILGSSTSLAAIASLGVHGLLLAILPVLPFESKSLESTSQRTVGLTELTPAELSRLPQVATSDIILPPFATQQSALPPLPPPPPIQPGGLPPLPSYQLPLNYPTGSNNSLKASSEAKTFRVRTSAPTQNKRSLPSVTAFNKTADSVRVQPFIPLQTNRATPPSGIVNTTNSPLNQTYRSGEFLPPPPPWTQPRVSGLPSTNNLTPQPFDPNNFPPSPPIPPVPSQQPGQPTINPSQNISPPQNQQIAANPPSTNRPPNQQIAPNPQTQPTPAARSPQGFENTKRELLARRDQLARANSARSPVVPPTSQNTPQRSREELQAALQQRLQSQPQSNPASSASKTTALAIRQLDEYQAQRQKVQENHPKVITKQPVRQRITTCDRALDGSVAYVNAVVNPQGKIIEGPTLYTKSGTVDTPSAIATVRNYAFRANSNTVSYDFAIAFKYDTGNCSEPAPEASPGNNQTQQSKS